MAKSKPKAKHKSFLRPGLLCLAAVLFWAARHQPASLTAASLGIWLLGALTIFLLLRAGLAFITPLMTLLGKIFSFSLRQMQQGTSHEG